MKAAITTKVIPAYAKFARFLQDTYLPACRGPIGAIALPQGREFYRNRVSYFTTVNVAPEELHETGIQENRRIRAEMNAIREAVKFDGDLEKFLKHLRTDERDSDGGLHKDARSMYR